MNPRFVAGSQLLATLLAVATVSVNAQPVRATRPLPIVPARPTHVGELHLTSAQRMQIRGIIASGRRDGMPTLETRREVLQVLTPAQRRRMERFVSRPARPL